MKKKKKKNFENNQKSKSFPQKNIPDVYLGKNKLTEAIAETNKHQQMYKQLTYD